MTALDASFIVIAATLLTAAVLHAIGWHSGRRVQRERIADLRPDDTPVERPILNPANRPLVSVLHGVAAEIEISATGTADGLRDIARVLQLSERETSEGERLKMAALVDEHGGVLKRGAQRIREAG